MTALLSNTSHSATYRWALPASRCCVSLFYALPASFAPAARLTIWSWRCLALVASDWMKATWRKRSSRISSSRLADWWITNRFKVGWHKSPPAGRACNYNEKQQDKTYLQLKFIRFDARRFPLLCYFLCYMLCVLFRCCTLDGFINVLKTICLQWLIWLDSLN